MKVPLDLYPKHVVSLNVYDQSRAHILTVALIYIHFKKA